MFASKLCASIAAVLLFVSTALGQSFWNKYDYSLIGGTTLGNLYGSSYLMSKHHYHYLESKPGLYLAATMTQVRLKKWQAYQGLVLDKTNAVGHEGGLTYMISKTSLSMPIGMKRRMILGSKDKHRLVIGAYFAPNWILDSRAYLGPTRNELILDATRTLLFDSWVRVYNIGFGSALSYEFKLSGHIWACLNGDIGSYVMQNVSSGLFKFSTISPGLGVIYRNK